MGKAVPPPEVKLTEQAMTLSLKGDPQGAVARLLEELATPRPLRSPFLSYGQETARELEILEAGSATEAKAMLAQHRDIAVALIDVVMETQRLFASRLKSNLPVAQLSLALQC